MEQNQTDHSLINWILSFFTAFFALLERSSADDIYNWTFRVLSLISVSLIIIINWKKAYRTLFPKK